MESGAAASPVGCRLRNQTFAWDETGDGAFESERGIRILGEKFTTFVVIVSPLLSSLLLFMALQQSLPSFQLPLADTDADADGRTDGRTDGGRAPIPPVVSFIHRPTDRARVCAVVVVVSS